MRSIVILTGAGLSKESGLDTFRDAGGIWSKVRLEDVATPEAYARDPERVQGFYNARRAQLRAAAIQPNAAHRALARLDVEWRGALLVITQNIDDLHERAGARRLLHMHGELLKSRCGACAAVAVASGDLNENSRCPDCGAVGRLRPHVVWFGEVPMGMDAIAEAVEGCDLFVSIGTSGAVYPAAGFAAAARAAGAQTLELNLEPTGGPFHQGRYGPATEIVPAFVEETLGRAAP